MTEQPTARPSRFQMQKLEDRIAPCSLGSVLSGVTHCNGSGTGPTPTPTTPALPGTGSGVTGNVTLGVTLPTTGGSCGCPVSNLTGGSLLNATANVGTNPLAVAANAHALNDAIRLTANVH